MKRGTTQFAALPWRIGQDGGLTNVLGDQILLLTSHRQLAATLWLVASVLWVVISIAFLSE